MNIRILKTILMATLFSYSLTAHATGEGFYLGLMLGRVTTDVKPILVQRQQPPGTPPPLLVTRAIPDNSRQYGFRIYLGYLFSRCIGAELGGSFFTSTRFNTFGVDTEGTPRIHVYAIDLVAKLVLPFRCFSIFGKIGPSVIFVSSSGGINPRLIPADPFRHRRVLVRFTRERTRFAPVISLGVAYDLTPNWQVDYSVNNFNVNGGIVNRITFHAIGISYHFVDRYCGQFLCD